MSNVKRYYWNADNIDGLGYGYMDLLADASSQELVDASDLSVAEQRAEHWRNVASEATARAASLNDQLQYATELLGEVARGGMVGVFFDGPQTDYKVRCFLEGVEPVWVAPREVKVTNVKCTRSPFRSISINGKKIWEFWK